MQATGQPGHSHTHVQYAHLTGQGRAVQGAANSFACVSRQKEGKNLSLLRSFHFFLDICQFYLELFRLPLLLTFTQKACSHGWRESVPRERGSGYIFEHCTLIMRRKEKKPKTRILWDANVDESRLSCVCSQFSGLRYCRVGRGAGGRVKGALNYAPVAYESECHFCCFILLHLNLFIFWQKFFWKSGMVWVK